MQGMAMDIKHMNAVTSRSQKSKSPSPADSHNSGWEAKGCVCYTMYSCNEGCETSLLKVQSQQLSIIYRHEKLSILFE